MKWFLALVVGLNLVVVLYGALKPHPVVDIHAQEVSPESLKLLPAGWSTASAPVAVPTKVAASSPVPAPSAASAATSTALPASLDAAPVSATAPAKRVVSPPHVTAVKTEGVAKEVTPPQVSVPPAPKLAQVKPEPRACFQWGPLDSRQLVRVKAALAPLKLTPAQLKEAESRERRGSGKFWVYHPALATHAETQTLVAELKGKGFDGYIVQNDEYKGSVSLGLFGSEASAQALAARVKAAGYSKVQVDVRGQQVISTRLTLDALDAEQSQRLKALHKRLLPGVSLAACQ